MSEEVISTPAPEETPAIVEGSEVASAPVVEGTNPEVNEEPKPEKKDGFQKRIDRLTREKYELKAQALALENQLRQSNPGVNAPAQTPNAAPDRSQFSDDTEYTVALIDHRANLIADQKLAQAKQADQANVVKSAWEKDKAAVMKVADDFDEVFQDFISGPNCTPTVDQLIMASKRPAAIADYLGRNEEVAEKIAQMSLIDAAAEIRTIQDKLTASGSAPKKASAAPAPIVPIAAKGGTGEIDPEKESPAQFAARRNKEIANRNKR